MQGCAIGWAGATYEEMTALLKEVLDILAPGSCAALHVPKLRHLGIIFVDHWDHVNMMQQDPRWATKPWTPLELQKQFEKPILKRAVDKFRSPALGPDIVKVCEQRRLLAAGGTLLKHSTKADASVAKRIHGPCAAIETIKLAGLRMQPSLLVSLAAQSGTSVSCHPRPSGVQLARPPRFG